MKPELPPSGDRGFSLLEVLLVLAITIVVMAMVAQTMAHVATIYRAQSDIATTSSGVSLALEDIAYEIALAGQGLGEGTAGVLPRIPGGKVSASALTLRSNPQVAASLLRSAVEAPGEAVAATLPRPSRREIKCFSPI